MVSMKFVEIPIGMIAPAREPPEVVMVIVAASIAVAFASLFVGMFLSGSIETTLRTDHPEVWKRWGPWWFRSPGLALFVMLGRYRDLELGDKRRQFDIHRMALLASLVFSLVVPLVLLGLFQVFAAR